MPFCAFEKPFNAFVQEMSQCSEVIALFPPTTLCAHIDVAFRVKMRTETLLLEGTAQNDPKQVEEKIQLAKDLAVMLRRNVVQAHRIESDSAGDAWSKYRITSGRHTVDTAGRSSLHQRH